jgi:hypothetical protein
MPGCRPELAGGFRGPFAAEVIKLPEGSAIVPQSIIEAASSGGRGVPAGLRGKAVEDASRRAV